MSPDRRKPPKPGVPAGAGSVPPASDPPPPPAPETTLDPTILDALRGMQEEGDPDIEGDLVNIFLAETPAKMAALEELAAKGDVRGLERAAHGLKGTGGTLGALGLAEKCRLVEEFARGGAIAAAWETVRTLPEEFERVKAALLARRASR